MESRELQNVDSRQESTNVDVQELTIVDANVREVASNVQELASNIQEVASNVGETISASNFFSQVHFYYFFHIQWGLEYQMLENRIHSKTERFEFWFLNGMVFKWLVP